MANGKPVETAPNEADLSSNPNGANSSLPEPSSSQVPPSPSRRSLSKPAISADAIAGFTAGAAATLIVHPLDVLKVRLQLDRTGPVRWGRSLEVLKNIVLTEGQRARTTGSGGGNGAAPLSARSITYHDVSSSIRALYRGLAPNLVGNSVSWGLYFFFYQELKSSFSNRRRPTPPSSSSSSPSTSFSSSPNNLPSVANLPASDYFLASSTAGILTVIFTNPIWVLKTRILSSGANTPGAYANMRAGIVSILRNEGIKGFYHGLIPSLVGVSHGAVQFVVYEMLKGWRSQSRSWSNSGSESPGEHDGTRGADQVRRTVTDRSRLLKHKPNLLSTADVLFCSIVSKATAAALTYPYQVVRTRLQTYIASSPTSPSAAFSTPNSKPLSLSSSSSSSLSQQSRPSRSVLSTVSDIWRQEGAVGFYKGLGANVVRVLPATCVTFVVYENVRGFLVRDSQSSSDRQVEE